MEATCQSTGHMKWQCKNYLRGKKGAFPRNLNVNTGPRCQIISEMESSEDTWPKEKLEDRKGTLVLGRQLDGVDRLEWFRLK